MEKAPASSFWAVASRSFRRASRPGISSGLRDRSDLRRGTLALLPHPYLPGQFPEKTRHGSFSAARNGSKKKALPCISYVLPSSTGNRASTSLQRRENTFRPGDLSHRKQKYAAGRDGPKQRSCGCPAHVGRCGTAETIPRPGVRHRRWLDGRGDSLAFGAGRQGSEFDRQK